MPLLKIPLAGLLASVASPIVKQVMISLGIGLISSAAIVTALSAAIASAQGLYSGLPSYIFSLAGLAGIGQGFGIIAGAMVYRVSLNAMPRIGVLPK